MTLAKVGVVDIQELNNLIEKGVCTSIDDLEFEDTQDFSYAQMAIVDTEINHILYWNDNSHSNPKLIFDGIKLFAEHYKLSVTFETKVMMAEELEKYSGVQYR